MKKLEDIPKKQIFEVPEGYFEKLPAIIQTRVTQEAQEYGWRHYPRGLRLAIPAVIVLVAGIFWVTRLQNDTSAENIIASVETEDLVVYLSEADVSTEELLENVILDTQDAMSIEASVYEFPLSDAEYEDILNEIE